MVKGGAAEGRGQGEWSKGGVHSDTPVSAPTAAAEMLREDVRLGARAGDVLVDALAMGGVSLVGWGVAPSRVKMASCVRCTHTPSVALRRNMLPLW